jgi:hypothetical protein
METNRRQALIATARSKNSTRQKARERDRFGNNSALSIQKDSTTPLSDYDNEILKTSSSNEIKKYQESK